MDLESLYVEMEPVLTAFFARRLFPRDRHLAPDLAADVFVRLLRHPEYAPSRRLAWTVARNLLTDHHQRRHPWGVACSLDADAHDRPDPSGDPDAALEQPPALDGYGLTPEQRRVLELRVLDGLSTRESARALCCSEEAVKKLKFRGLARLRRQLEVA